MEASPVESFGKASVEQDNGDSLLILMEDIQHATTGSPVTTSSESTTAVNAQTVEKVFLLELSANKERIAYVVEIQQPNQGKHFYLKIRGITYPTAGPVLSEDALEEDITDCMQCLDEFTYYFLSLSSNGDCVALSFYKLDSPKKRLTAKRPTCFIFHIHESGFKLAKKIECQGKAVFSPNGQLVIVKKNILQLYNCNDDYRLASSLDIEYLFPPNFQYYYADDFFYRAEFQALWCSSYNGPLDHSALKEVSSIRMMIHLTRFINYSLLTPCFAEERWQGYGGPSVWSLDDGVRSIPLERIKGEEIHAVSSDKTLIGTFGRDSEYLSVYHLRSGLWVSKLRSAKNAKARQRFPLNLMEPKVLHYGHFSRDNQYVFLFSIHTTTNPEKVKEALLMIEAWDRDAENLIFQYEELIDIAWHSKSRIEPYIIESASSPPTFTAIYPTFLEDDTWIIKSLDVKLFHTCIWNLVESPVDTQNDGFMVWTEKTDDEFTKAAFTLTAKSRSNGVVYELRFSHREVTLWRLYREENQENESLIYIHIFHVTQYHQRGFFDKVRKLEDYGRLQIRQNVNSLPLRITVPIGDGIAIKVKYDMMDVQKEQVYQIYPPFADLEIAEESCTAEEKPFEFACVNFHYIESACKALHFFCTNRSKSLEGANPEQIKKLIEHSIKKMQQDKSRYFTTISGSNTLAMLASFQEGRNIIFQILQTDDLPINLFSYLQTFISTDRKQLRTVRKENALTILIEEFDYELFGLLFNRALLHATISGVGALCAISDTLIFLQTRSETEIFRQSCQKLKFLKVQANRGPWLGRMYLDLHRLHNGMMAGFSDFPSYGLLEQLPTYIYNKGLRLIHELQQNADTLEEIKFKWLYSRDSLSYYTHLQRSMVHTKLLSICCVPFIHLSSYTIFEGDLEYSYYGNRDDVTWTARLNAEFRELFDLSNNHNKIVHKAESDLMRLASNQHRDDLFHQKESVIEVLLYYKWKTFLRRRFYLVYGIHLLYYLSFCIGVLFARECFDYVIGTPIPSNSRHNGPIALMFVANFILSIQELRQLLKLGLWRYLASIYNIVDMAALTMPPVCFGLMITGNSSLDETNAIATIILWVHGILRLRPFAFIGVALETMIQLIKSVYKTLIIMLLVIFAFTHAFIVLLLHKDDSYFQEQYSGSINLTDSESTVNYSDTSAGNSFTNVFKAFSTLWLFIYGVWDPITDGDAGDDFMIIVFALLFSFVTVLLFFNLVIALMSSKAEEVKALGKSIWLSHFAEVIAEIEQFWCTRSEQVNRNNSPSVVYYIAKSTDVRQQAELLEQECDELIKELQVKLEKRQRADRSTQ